MRDLLRELHEVRSRTAPLLYGAESWLGPLTADEASRKAFLEGILPVLLDELDAVLERLPEEGGGGRDVAPR